MPLFVLEKEFAFPPVHLAEPDGLLAVGGDLSVDRLLIAYSKGIFPWYEGKHILVVVPRPTFCFISRRNKSKQEHEKIAEPKCIQFYY